MLANLCILQIWTCSFPRALELVDFKMGPCAALVTCATIKDWENLISVQKTWLKGPIILHHHSHLDFLMVRYVPCYVEPIQHPNVFVWNLLSSRTSRGRRRRRPSRGGWWKMCREVWWVKLRHIWVALSLLIFVELRSWCSRQKKCSSNPDLDFYLGVSVTFSPLDWRDLL